MRTKQSLVKLTEYVEQKSIEEVKSKWESDKKQFLQIPYLILNNPKALYYSETLPLYLKLFQAKADWYNPNDNFGLFNTYFANLGLIVSAIPQTVLSAVFGVSVSTIKRWIKKLEHNGAFYIKKIKLDGYRKMNIYVLGEVNEKGERVYSYEKQID